jgi:hypothetical protein
MSVQTEKHRGTLSPGLAMRIALPAYVVLLFFPLILLAVVYALYSHPGMSPRLGHGATTWFVLAMAYLAFAVPAALFYRRHVCAAYARGGMVAPRQYLQGMLTVWLTLEIGVVVPIVGCYVTGSFLPVLLPAAVAFVFLITLWPAGRMMIGRGGASEDPETYQPPR